MLGIIAYTCVLLCNMNMIIVLIVYIIIVASWCVFSQNYWS